MVRNVMTWGGLLQDIGSISLEENLEPIKVSVSKKSVEVFQSIFPNRVF
jgi:hypothetical protein